MLFSSTVFLFLFLPLILLVYAAVPRRTKNPVLLLASLFFYFWGEGFFVLVMLASIGANYGFGLALERTRRSATRKRLVALAVVLNIGLLGAYKYLDWGFENLDLALEAAGLSPLGLEASERLPIGISFFTFQALSYVIDVYRGDARVQRSPLDLTLYVSMFPQLVAGPIVRYSDIEYQLSGRSVGLDRLALGVRRFVVGLAKKVLIANALQGPVDAIYALPSEDIGAPVAWLGVVCYTFQLYFDFSGYSDMAVGLGHMFGFKLPENFDYPFVSRSVREIWKRWHMSLTTWFRDYVYFPLGGSRGGGVRTHLNLVLVFVLVGLWHGAAWHFVVFGLYHGVFLVLERQKSLAPLGSLPRAVQHLYAMSIWVVGLVMFRSESVGQALTHYAAMFGLHGRAGMPLEAYFTREIAVVLPLAALASLPLGRLLRERFEGRAPVAVRVGELAGVSLLLLASVLVLAATTHQPFIYFRF